MSKNCDRFSLFNPQQRAELCKSLIEFCESGNAAISQLASLPLFQNIFGAWIVLCDTQVPIRELDPKDLPRAVIELLSQVKFTCEIIPVQSPAIRAYLGTRMQPWGTSDFLEHVLNSQHTVFDLLSRQQKQVLLSMIHLPNQGIRYSPYYNRRTRQGLRLTSAYLRGVSFIPSGNELLPLNKVYDDTEQPLRTLVELLDLPRVSAFYTEQVSILRANHPTITFEDVRSY